MALWMRMRQGCKRADSGKKAPEYRCRAVSANKRPRRGNGAPWCDPDLLHVLVVAILANVATAGLVYAWFLWRTWHVASTAPQQAGTVAGAIVFGKRLVEGRPDEEYRWRLRQALRLLRRDPAMVLLLTGGPAGEGPSEAGVAREWLLRRMPAAAPRLRVEERSLHTIDNLREARTLLPAGRIALLSNRYHLARCLTLARSLDLDVQACAAEPWLPRRRGTARRLVLEAGYHMLFVIGRGWARLIGSRRMLARVT